MSLYKRQSLPSGLLCKEEKILKTFHYQLHNKVWRKEERQLSKPLLVIKYKFGHTASILKWHKILWNQNKS